jgi:ribosome-associated protein
MSKSEPQPTASRQRFPADLLDAARAAADKKAFDMVALDLRKTAAFTDYFLICSGQGPRQVTTIADAIQESMARQHTKPAHIEGYERAGWILIDCFDFVVHVFTPETRAFYALERLWGSAETVTLPIADTDAPAPRP